MREQEGSEGGSRKALSPGPSPACGRGEQLKHAFSKAITSTLSLPSPALRERGRRVVSWRSDRWGGSGAARQGEGLGSSALSITP